MLLALPEEQGTDREQLANCVSMFIMIHTLLINWQKLTCGVCVCVCVCFPVGADA